jgi:penicillin-binding protein 1C
MELETRIATLAKRLRRIGLLTEEELQIIRETPLTVSRGNLPVRADHFVRYVNSLSHEISSGGIVTTLDISIQQRAQAILEERVSDLLNSNVNDGAILIVDNTTAEVLAWVNAGEFGPRDESQIDAVITPRQPGSTLKPLLYARAFEKGWKASTLIDDSPLLLPVGAGLHTYRNYSRVHYGDISVREALGNSLNIPAIRAVQFVGKEEFLHFLQRAGFSSLSRTSEHYGEGLALGNGEVTLFELVQSYTALANRGVWRPLRVLREEKEESLRPTSLPLISSEVASIISDILSDPYARRREFGVEGLLRFPIQTAIKTGTSSDFRDAWAIGYTDRYTVGVWMGNLNRASMNQISGARGPALVLRSIFSELHRTIDSNGLFLARSIRRHTICTESGHLASSRCPQKEELFVPGTEPTLTCNGSHLKNNKKHGSLSAPSIEDPKMVMPTPGLHVARDPRIPDTLEALAIEVAALGDISGVTWYVDGMRVSRTGPGKLKYLWPLVEGRHTVRAEVIRSHEAGVKSTSEVAFWVR